MLCTTVHTVSISYGHKIRERYKERRENPQKIYTKSLIDCGALSINNSEHIGGLM